MAATRIDDEITAIRAFLLEKTARFWQNPELKSWYGLGVQNLWGSILDLHGDHYNLVNASTVQMAANATVLSGVPDNCFRVLLIEPRTLTSDGSGRYISFVPRKYNHPEFQAARSLDPVDQGSGGIVYYHMSGVGAPISAPTIYVAPAVSADLDLRMSYCPTIEVEDHNPIPGQSDNALRAWTIAYALGKEGEQGSRVPDAGWLSIYGTEKQSILTRLTPRQEQEPEIVDGMWEGLG